MSKLDPITDNDLLAYADDRLDAPRRAEVEAFLAAHPERAAEVQHWLQQNEAIAALFGGPAEPVPARLDPRRITAERQARMAAWPRFAAAAVVVLALGAGLGWAGRDWIEPPETAAESLIASAVGAHRLYVQENRHAVEVGAGEEQHLFTWLSNRIERQIATPDLVGEGFELVGGRLLPGSYEDAEAGPAAQLMYQNASAQRVTVYITAAEPGLGKAYQFESRDAVEAFYWSDDRITCTVVGDLPEEEMKAVARKVYQQLTIRPDPAPGTQPAAGA
jgi:anti-sigma factor RsiW